MENVKVKYTEDVTPFLKGQHKLYFYVRLIIVNCWKSTKYIKITKIILFLNVHAYRFWKSDVLN
jgi:hypothetical protein